MASAGGQASTAAVRAGMAVPLAAAVLAAAERLRGLPGFVACGAAARPRGERLLPAARPSLGAAPAGASAAGQARGVLSAAAAVAAWAAAVGRPSRHQPRRRAGLARRAAEAEGPSLSSSLGLDYSALRDALASGDFKAADAETRRLLIEIAGEAARKRGWIYFAEVKNMPEADMNTVEGLWQHYSKGKFGFVAQRKIWKSCRADFAKFAEQVSWFTGKWENRNWPDEFIYDLSAPVGHLPLTNCIRGDQVLQELLNHPAFEKKKATPQAGGKRSPLSMLAFGGAALRSSSVRGRPMTGGSLPAGLRS